MGLRTESMISNLQEKLTRVGEESMSMMNNTQAKLKEMGADEMISNLQEKLARLGEESMTMMNNTHAKLKEMGAYEMINNLQEKLTGLGEESMIMMNNTQAKLKDMGADQMVNNLQEKLKEIRQMPENFGLFLIGWLDKVERIRHWLHVSAPFIVAGLVFLVLFWCCRSCISCCWVCCSRCIRCCWVCCSRCIRCCCSNKPVKMMKAPGRIFMTPRHVFESNPKGYFRSLHASKLKY